MYHPLCIIAVEDEAVSAAISVISAIQDGASGGEFLLDECHPFRRRESFSFQIDHVRVDSQMLDEALQVFMCVGSG